MVEVLLALVAAAGSVGTAYVIHVLGVVRAQTNGALLELSQRVALLEELVTFAAGRDELSEAGSSSER